ncbi:MAG: hypothetical protein J6K19_11340 [Prevotella sp.]|nr:hypothetical protein [Prevotella sp.]
MADFEEELRMDEEENAREAEYILGSIPAELKEKYTTDDILYMMDAIVEYYYTSGVLDGDADADGFVDIDLQKVADYVCRKAAEDKRGCYDPDEVFFVAQADLDFQEACED